jgi:hypothetical protein
MVENSSASNWSKAVVYHTGKVDSAKHLKIGPVPGEPTAILPGYGIEYLSCGTVRHRVNCVPSAEGGHLNYHRNSCDRKECPVCSTKWANRRAREAAKRFWWIFENQDNHVSKNAKNARHVSVGIPPSMWGRPYHEVMKWVAAALRDSLRSGGGLYVGHAWRFKDSRGEPVQWKHSDLNPQAIYPIIDSWAVYSPHVHFVIFGWLIPVDEFEAKYGCRYTYHDSTPSELEVYFCIRYLLTHTALIENRHSLIWFGKCSYNRVVIDREFKELVRALCPICHKPMFYETPEGTWEPWHIEITRRHYKFKVIQKYLKKIDPTELHITTPLRV